MKLYQDIIEFDWDESNVEKNWLKHLVSKLECEEIFFNFPVFVYDDEKHSNDESRFYALGKTLNNRHLLIVFTFRKKKVRVISARDMNKKEGNIYNEESKKYT